MHVHEARLQVAALSGCSRWFNQWLITILAVPGFHLNETACLESAHQTGFESAVSCFSTEDRTTFWAGNVIIQSRWCFLVTRLSSTSCCGLNAIFTISVEDEADVTAGQVWNYPFLDIHDEISYITVSRSMYSPKKSWSIYDSDICITSIVKWCRRP